MEKQITDADIRSRLSGCNGFPKVLSGFHWFEVKSFDDVTNVQARSLLSNHFSARRCSR